MTDVKGRQKQRTLHEVLEPRHHAELAEHVPRQLGRVERLRCRRFVFAEAGLGETFDALVFLVLLVELAFFV